MLRNRKGAEHRARGTDTEKGHWVCCQLDLCLCWTNTSGQVPSKNASRSWSQQAGFRRPVLAPLQFSSLVFLRLIRIVYSLPWRNIPSLEFLPFFSWIFLYLAYQHSQISPVTHRPENVLSTLPMTKMTSQILELSILTSSLYTLINTLRSDFCPYL